MLDHVASWYRARDLLVSQVVRYIKGESVIHIVRRYMARKRSYVGHIFGQEGTLYPPCTREEEVIRNYIRHQGREDRRIDQLNLM